MQAALEAVTATHQLESAVDVFSWCVRPLLRQGYLQPLTQDIGAERVSGSADTHSSHTRHRNAWVQSLSTAQTQTASRPAKIFLGCLYARKTEGALITNGRQLGRMVWMQVQRMYW